MGSKLKIISLNVFLISILVVVFFNIGFCQDNIELKFSHELPIDHPWGVAAIEFEKYIEEKTNNQIEVTVYHAGQLGRSGGEIQEELIVGTIDIGISSTPIVLLNPLQQLFDLPFLFKTREQAWEILDGSIGQRVASNLEKRGLKVLAYWEDGFRQITTGDKRIEGINDFQGLKIRTPQSSQRIATFRALGSRPTPMPFSEVFSALEQGVIDGQENPLSVIYATSLYDVQKYLIITNHVYSPATLIMNLNKWNSLSENNKKIITEAAKIGRDKNRELNKISDEVLVSKLKEKGMEIIVLNAKALSDMEEKVSSVWDEFISSQGKEAEDLLNQIMEILK